MKKKKILIISYSYPPANVPAAQRPYSIAKYLDKDKFDVSVLTCGNQDSSLGFDIGFNEELPNVKLLKVNGFKVSKSRAVVSKASTSKTGLKVRFKQKLVNILSYFIFPDKAMFWYPFVLKYVRKNKQNMDYDYIFSTSPAFTNHLIAGHVKRFTTNAVHIADFRDYHYFESRSKTTKNLKLFLHKRLENKILEKADKVSFISEAMTKQYAKAYPQYQNKFFAFYNGFDKPEYKNTMPIVSDKLKIFYAGSFYKGVRSPFPLLKILDALIEKNEINSNDLSIEIAGNFDANILEDLKKYKSYKSIVFLGLLPRNEVLTKYQESHLLWLIVGDEVAHYTGLPIKFYEYMASQRPIINFAPSDSEPTKVIDKYQIGWNFDSDKEDIEQKIEIFRQIIVSYRKGELSQALAVEKLSFFSRKEQTKVLEKMISHD